MSAGSFRYFEHVRRVHRKFSRNLSEKIFFYNWRFFRIFYMTLSFIFQNLNSFHFSWHIIRLVRRMVTIFLLTQRIRSSGPPRYLQCCRKPYRKFSRDIWKKILQLKIWDFVRMKFNIKFEYSDKTSCFELQLFFQVALENFL